MTTDELHRLRIENDQLRRDAATVLRYLDTLRARVAELEADKDEMLTKLGASLRLRTKLRERAEEAEAERDELRARLTPGGAVVGVRTASESGHDRPPGSER